MEKHVRILTLDHQQDRESELFVLKKGWVLEFRLGVTLFGRLVKLFCNYPRHPQEFMRYKYTQLDWDHEDTSADDTALKSSIILNLSGTFRYYFTYDEPCGKQQGSGYFIVEPELIILDGEILHFDAIQCQSVISKCLGSFESWEERLKVSKATGYNLIHFTPVHELGGSNSAYCLRDQLNLNPSFKTNFAKLHAFIQKLCREWGIISICDIVLNHTSNESPWLHQHPEVTYNCLNCAYLKPAYLLDVALSQFSQRVAQGWYEKAGIPRANICNEDHLSALGYQLRCDIIVPLKLHEFYMCNVAELCDEFRHKAQNTSPIAAENVTDKSLLKLIAQNSYTRLGYKVELDLALKLFNTSRKGCLDEANRLKLCINEFKVALETLNTQQMVMVQKHCDAAVGNCLAHVRYQRVQWSGPRITTIDRVHPLFERYFTDAIECDTIDKYENVLSSDKSQFIMAHNGWVMNADPLVDFADASSFVYIRRELIPWGDSVKLRYGKSCDDNPELWNRMRAYVEQTATIFGGIRLDNCHSTPIHVAEYMLDAARLKNPNLYVIAELFTNSDKTDNIFVNRLGIKSLIRESLSAWNSQELGRLVYRFGGQVVGAFMQPPVRPIRSSVAHAIFFDATHDNPSVTEKRTTLDFVPNAALVAMACCATGSNRGCDELVPHHIDVVKEKRLYMTYESLDVGMLKVKRSLNDLHLQLAKQGFNQVFVDQLDYNVVAVTRHCPVSHQKYILVAFTAFNYHVCSATCTKSLKFEGFINEIVLEASISHSGNSEESFEQHRDYINGYTNEYLVNLRERLPAHESKFIYVEQRRGEPIKVKFTQEFRPGAIIVLKVSLAQPQSNAIAAFRDIVSTMKNDVSNYVQNMTLGDLNYMLYSCEPEERERNNDCCPYDIPGYGSLPYAGIQGFISLLSQIRPEDDLGHPMCNNLRDGDWMIDYVWQRLLVLDSTRPLARWMEKSLAHLKAIPRYLIPSYFDLFLVNLYVLVVEHVYASMSKFIQNGSTFVRALALGSVQFSAHLLSAPLLDLSKDLPEPKPPRISIQPGAKTVQACVSLAAGLPHFAVGYMRNWGRDTFISLRGLYLVTGRYQEARFHILAYASCLRHGLIPNLLNQGHNARFNCRDAVWWWLYCIKNYVEMVPDGERILVDPVNRLFPSNEQNRQCKLQDVMQEALQVHFQGLIFREHNAGRAIDENMVNLGFNNRIGVHTEIGFVYGGSAHNCGTWMDKMGSAEGSAQNKGRPATPRDGSAIELVALAYTAVKWLAIMNEQNKYPFSGVERTLTPKIMARRDTKKVIWAFKDWATRMKDNFERCFWIGWEQLEDQNPPLVHKRTIYKDTFNSSIVYTDYQLRCNYVLAMVVAPDLFQPAHACQALQSLKTYKMLGPMGIKTLDPDDWNYCGVYDNSKDENCDAKIAHGFNYHQGPEWVWPMGYYLRAKLLFDKRGSVRSEVIRHLSPHFEHLQRSMWRGLPELTNENGAECPFSANTQAWSMASIMEVLYDLQSYKQ